MNYSRRILIFFICVLAMFAVAYLTSHQAEGDKALPEQHQSAGGDKASPEQHQSARCCDKASPEQAAGGSKESLDQKIQQEWTARKSRNMEAVYEMTTQAHKKEVSRGDFLQRNHIYIEDYTVKDVKIEESGKEAFSTVDYLTNQMGFKFTFTTKEKWIWENGEWRLKLPSPKEYMSPFDTKKK
jgi:hypothetical protein